MRMIDADLMKESIVVMDRNLAEALREWIDAQPTIEPQRMRGRWEYLDYGGVGNYHCSACRRICVNKGDYAFCPHCGAWMEGQDDR